jgi:hypothetical protein
VPGREMKCSGYIESSGWTRARTNAGIRQVARDPLVTKVAQCEYELKVRQCEVVRTGKASPSVA